MTGATQGAPCRAGRANPKRGAIGTGTLRLLIRSRRLPAPAFAELHFVSTACAVPARHRTSGMLPSLRQASRLLASPATSPAALCRVFSSQAGALGSLMQQTMSLWSGLQQPAAAVGGAAAQLAAPLPPHVGLLPLAAQAALLRPQPAPALLPELAEILGGLDGEGDGVDCAS